MTGFDHATGLDAGDQGAEGVEREQIRWAMMVDHPAPASKVRLERAYRRIGPAAIDRMHRDNVVGLERLYKRAWQGL